MRRTLAVVALAASVAACGGSDDGPVADLGRAACADLRSGMSITQVAAGGLDAGLSRKRVAAALVLGTENECPEYRDDLQATAVPSWLD